MNSLTERQKEIAALVAMGVSNYKISRKLVVVSRP
jgi:DNA-binding NarL/FixJ family response regulator